MIAEDGHQPSPAALAEDAAAVDDLVQAFARLRGEIARVVVGQERVVEELMIALLCQGHCILEGVPGLAKTLLVSTLARTLSMSFSRVQFTPDLMPSDITGTEVIEDDRATGTRQLRFVRGPVFANVILADEINRTPPKTQAALLEAMQERQVTAAGFTHKLPLPFSCWPHRTRSSRKAPIHCPRLSSIASCSRFTSVIRRKTRNCGSSG